MSNSLSKKRTSSKSESPFQGPRIPPQAVEAEESVLGGILLDNDAINVALELIRPEDFYRATHRSIFEAMASLSDRREPIDVITLSQQLRAAGSLEDIGGIEALSRMAALVPSAANVGYYARLVKETALKRRVIHEATEIITEAFKESKGVEDFLDSVEQRIFAVSEYRVAPAFYKVGEVVKDAIKHVENLYDKKQLVTGVSTGFERLDFMTAGFQPGDLIIVAARPSMGKTSLALGIAQHAAIVDGKGVAVFSLEMSKEQLVLRMLCSEGGVDSSKVRTGHLGERDFPRLVEAASRIAEAPVFIDDTPAVTVTECRAKARRLHREHKLSLIVVDYLQLMRSPAYSNSREQEISDISRSLKALAKELHVPVVALSQLNRSVESRTDRRPIMSDLRESGAIEQDADVIGFIYRDEVYNKETEEKGIAEFIIAKQRNGPTGTVKLHFASEITRFYSLDETHSEQAEENAGSYEQDRFVMPAGEMLPSTQISFPENPDDDDDDMI